MSKFHGLSSPDELINMWRDLRYDDDDEDINVIWEYVSPDQLKDGFNIVNIKYDPKHPKEIGHYVLISILDKKLEYFNPVASHTRDDEEKLNELLNYAEEKGLISNVDLTGKQSEDSENCGFHCLTHAYNLYRKHNERNKDTRSDKEDKPKAEEVETEKIKETETEAAGASKPMNDDDKMDTLIKTVRGIYFGLKYGFDQQTPNNKKASGLMPYHYKGYGPRSEIRREQYNQTLPQTYGSGLADYGKKYYTYTGMRHEVEDKGIKK